MLVHDTSKIVSVRYIAIPSDWCHTMVFCWNA